MVKLTIEGNVFEGTPEEIRETVAMLSELAKAQEGAEKKEPVKKTHPIEGKEYENLCRVQPQEGDYVKFKSSTVDITAGKEYEVVSHDGNLAIIDDTNDPRTILLHQRSRFEIRGVDYDVNAREEDEYKEGDIVEHGRAWFGREGIGEVERAFEDGSYLVKGVNDKGVEVRFYLRPHNMKLIATVENREDIEGTE